METRRSSRVTSRVTSCVHVDSRLQRRRLVTSRRVTTCLQRHRRKRRDVWATQVKVAFGTSRCVTSRDVIFSMRVARRFFIVAEVLTRTRV